MGGHEIEREAEGGGGGGGGGGGAKITRACGDLVVCVIDPNTIIKGSK